MDYERLASTVQAQLREHPSQNRFERLRKLREVLGSLQESKE